MCVRHLMKQKALQNYYLNIFLIKKHFMHQTHSKYYSDFGILEAMVAAVLTAKGIWFYELIIS